MPNILSQNLAFPSRNRDVSCADITFRSQGDRFVILADNCKTRTKSSNITVKCGLPPLPPPNILHRLAMISQHEAEIKELNDILYTMELRHRERETEADHEFQGMMDELKNKVSTRLIH